MALIITKHLHTVTNEKQIINRRPLAMSAVLLTINCEPQATRCETHLMRYKRYTARYERYTTRCEAHTARYETRTARDERRNARNMECSLPYLILPFTSQNHSFLTI